MSNNNIREELLAKCMEAAKGCDERVPQQRFFGLFCGTCEAEFESKREEGGSYTRPAVKLMNVSTDKVFDIVVSPFVRDELRGSASLSVGDRITITRIQVGTRQVEGNVYPDYRFKVVNDDSGEVLVDVKL